MAIFYLFTIIRRDCPTSSPVVATILKLSFIVIGILRKGQNSELFYPVGTLSSAA